MKVVLQVVSKALVEVDNNCAGKIDKGYLLMVGISQTDTIEDAKYLASKISKIRLFDDSDGKINLSLNDVSGSILSISNFTLLANTKKGNRPSFMEAAKGEEANRLYQEFNQLLRNEGLTVQTGQFGEDMTIQTTLRGPETIVFDTNAI